jgi:polyhydroxyalkanoic acid synthase PhaR subunit
VPNEARSQNFMNPWEFWKQWNDMTVSMWTNTIQNDKKAGKDPYDFYSSWIKAVDTIQERMKTRVPVLPDLQEEWKLWLDTTMDIWRSAASMGGDPLGLITGWVKVMEHVQQQVRSGESALVDPFMLFHEWYNTTSEQWSSLVKEMISSEQFLAFSGPFLESSSNLTSTFRHASEEFFKTLRLPTISDITNVAKLVVALEEKVDTIEATIERVEENTTQGTATVARVTDLEQQLHRIETKLDRMLAHIEKVEAGTEGGSAASLPRASTRKRDKQDEDDRGDQ